jgi:hypothetical protein
MSDTGNPLGCERLVCTSFVHTRHVLRLGPIAAESLVAALGAAHQSHRTGSLDDTGLRGDEGRRRE